MPGPSCCKIGQHWLVRLATVDNPLLSAWLLAVSKDPTTFATLLKALTQVQDHPLTLLTPADELADVFTHSKLTLLQHLFVDTLLADATQIMVNKGLLYFD